MQSPTNNQFGLIVAYVLPGFIGLAGIAPLAPAIAGWLHPVHEAEASFGSPIYVLLLATTIGMIVSCFRWLLIDHLLQWMGMIPPVWDDSRLEERLVAFNYLVESHYRYYQFVSNTLVAVVWAYSVNRWIEKSSLLGLGTDLGVLILCATLFAASRDSLSKYYTRTGRLVGQVVPRDVEDQNMYNGNDHGGEGGAGTKPRPEPKPEQKPAAEKPERGKDKTAQPRK